jgi:hypothetical protein
MCNIGSSTDVFRKKEQPWIDEYVFKPARDKNRIVRHLDVKDATGVDIVGDISDPHFVEKLSRIGFKSVFCSNLLEHVKNRDEICNILTSIITPGGYIFLSCPFMYPFHADPIDTMFRPDVGELAKQLTNVHIVHGDVVICGTYMNYITRNPLVFAKTFIRILFPFYRPMGWFASLYRLPWLFRNFQATCIVVRKN